jgi:hypothetical protein
MAEGKTALPARWIAVCVVCLLAGGAAAYFLLVAKPDTARLTAEAPSNVQQAPEQELPVHVLTPPSFGALDPQLQNSSANKIALRVTVRRPGSSEQHEWLMTLEPNQTLSLGRQGGWTFADGDDLELVQDGYRPKKVRLQ